MRKKLILFDIDGTLVLTGGVAAGIMAEAVSEVLGKPLHWSIEEFVGNTDQRIIFTLLHRNGVPDSMLDELIERALNDYITRLRIALKNDTVIQILPGVPELLEVLKNDTRFTLGLLTGNVLEAAQIKLARENLFRYFPVGAFGEDAVKREDLPPFAIQRAEKYYRHFYDKKDVWIVGDSINDIKCARANRLRSLAVASGHTPEAELKAHKPSSLVPDLRDTGNILRILLS